MPAARKLSITLTEEMATELETVVASGEFVSTSEVMRDALRVWRREREEHAAQLAVLRARLQAAIDDPRPRLSVDEVFDQLKQTRTERLNRGRPHEAA